ncbi:MAG: phosphoglycerate dehydrogenase, partial [bacterium]|nr:phosphoglycerate dehydrogenase [bacterium]
MKILCTIEGFSDEAKPLLEKAGTVIYRTPSPEELPRVVAEYDALLVRIGLQISRNVIDAAPHLKAIATATTGLNHIDVVYAKEKGISVLSLKDEVEFLDTITSTAELAFGLLIDLMRMTPWAFDSVKRYELKLEEFRGHSLYGKTLGIIGMGR